MLTIAQIKPLKPGDAVPSGILTSFDKSIQPSFGNQLIILDFFATWCTTCLRSLPKLDSLQQQYKPQLQLLLVSNKKTGDDSAKVIAYFNKRTRPDGNPWGFAWIANDTVLGALFPHTAVPRYVWIKQGRVLAVTSWRQISAVNIEEAIALPPCSLPSFAYKN